MEGFPAQTKYIRGLSSTGVSCSDEIHQRGFVLRQNTSGVCGVCSLLPSTRVSCLDEIHQRSFGGWSFSDKKRCKERRLCGESLRVGGRKCSRCDSTTCSGSGQRITVLGALRWAACGAVSVGSTSALLIFLFSSECEPQNIAAYDKQK